MENLSAYPVDLCRLSFQDNHSSELTSQLLDTETDMPPTEAHELDWELQHQAVFSWAEKPESFRIEAGKKSTLTIQCYGKYGW